MTNAQQPLPSLRRNVGWTFVGNVVYAACQWAILVVLARLGTTSVVGLFALALAVTGPVIMLANMQLRWVQATDSRREFAFADCFGLRLICLAVGLIVLALITAFTEYDRETTLVIFAVAAAKTIEAVSDVIHGWYQQHERMELIAWSLMIRGPVSLLAMFAGYQVGELLGGCICLAICWLATLVFYDVPQAIRFARSIDHPFTIAWNAPKLRTVFRKALPVGLTAGVVALLANIPRYVVEGELGKSELGIFAAMAYVLLAAETFVRAVNQSAMPRLSHYLRESNIAGFHSVVRNLAKLGVACGVVALMAAWVAGPFFLRHVYGEEYANNPHVLTLMVAGAALSFALRPSEVALRSMRKFNTLLVVNAISLPLLLLLTMSTVPRYGMWGAAIAMLVQVAVHGALTVAVFYRMAPRTNSTVAPELKPHQQIAA